MLDLQVESTAEMSPQNHFGTSLISSTQLAQIAVVIPAYKVKQHILPLIESIDDGLICRIYVVDDCCPEKSGKFVEENCKDKRVRIISHTENQGVGGAVISGYKAALEEKMDIVVKLDGDGQMDPALLPYFIKPLLKGEADYTKGNRFYCPGSVQGMPRKRKFGNVVLSFITKASTGYWNIFDPTNGYTAIQTKICRLINLDKISKRYFFETDMLSHLGLLHAVVLDIPMNARYGDEVSNLHIKQIVGDFLWQHLKLSLRRLKYQYYVNDLRVGSLFLPLSLIFLTFGGSYTAWQWFSASEFHHFTSPGRVMIGALPIILGFQMLLSFIISDIVSTPSRAISANLPKILK